MVLNRHPYGKEDKTVTANIHYVAFSRHPAVLAKHFSMMIVLQQGGEEISTAFPLFVRSCTAWISTDYVIEIFRACKQTRLMDKKFPHQSDMQK